MQVSLPHLTPSHPLTTTHSLTILYSISEIEHKNGKECSMKQFDTNSKGFTIVELLVVIVVIGILAAISIVTYSGIRNKANDTTIQSDLRNTQAKIQLWMADNDTPPAATPGAQNETFVVTRQAYDMRPNSNSLLYCRTDEHFAIVARSNSGNNFYYSSVLGNGSLPTMALQGNATVICPQVGISDEAGANYARRWILYHASWREDFTPGA